MWIQNGEQRIWLSPYNYVQNNPINRIDPTGALDWKPDANGNLIGEEGDDALTLSKYLDISFDDAVALFTNRNNWDGGKSTTGIVDVTRHTLTWNQSGGSDLSLAVLYFHFQFGGGDPINIKMSSVDFGGATQRDLGLTGMNAGDVRAVHLFRANALTTAGLVFGRVNMMAHGNNQFSIVSDNSARFDFVPLIDRAASLERNVGNVLGAGINYNIWLMPIIKIAPAIPLIFGGSFDVNFKGSTTILR